MLTALIDRLALAFRRDEEGQGLAEYALILALIAIAVIAALIFLGGAINDILNEIGSAL
jgi:pilus assembly protein Flp/PilA